MANVSLSDVRDTINVSTADVPDVKLQKMVKRAEVTLELSREIDYAACSDAEKEFITLLAAIYAVCYLTGGSAVGLSFTVGDQKRALTETTSTPFFLSRTTVSLGIFSSAINCVKVAGRPSLRSIFQLHTSRRQLYPLF